MKGYLPKKNHKEAIELLKVLYGKYASDSFYNIYSLGGIGRCYYALGKYDKAIEYFEKILGQHSDVIGFSLVVYYYYLGLAYAKLGFKEKALEAFEKSIQLCRKERRNQKAFPHKEAKKAIEDLKISDQ